METLAALCLVVCAVSSLIFLVQAIGGFFGMFAGKQIGTVESAILWLVVAIISGAGFAFATGSLFLASAQG
jgi:hypothetical protein